MHFDSKEIMKILKISKQSLYYRRTNNLIKFKKINNKIVNAHKEEPP